ncbi:AzlC family ABC transporter permease [Brevibacterium litoralis]|uniref:AzlC family ABC transporter permease n=1 Tax=Brevibacterium litoralis TaxID=3138935 RepID=UPI0032EFEDBE
MHSSSPPEPEGSLPRPEGAAPEGAAPEGAAPEGAAPEASWRRGWILGITHGAAAFVLALTYGTYAASVGIPAWVALLMSLLVFSGTAQFAFATTLAGGGGFPAAVGSAALINVRFLPMAANATTALRGGPLRRALEAQLTLDVSWAAGQRADGTVDRAIFMPSALVQFPCWLAGTAIGAFFAPDAEVLRATGLDVVFPAFFAMMLAMAVKKRPELRLPVGLCVVVTLAALAFLPSGTALLVGSLPGLLWGAMRKLPPAGGAGRETVVKS